MLLVGVWPGFLLASALAAAGGCKRDSSSDPLASRSSASPAVRSSAHASSDAPVAANPSPQAPPTGSIDDDVKVELPDPPTPPELRTDEERADADKLLASYGFPAHQSLLPLCGWRDFNPGGTTWVVDLFTSPLPTAELRHDYIKRLGKRGLEADTWTIAATGTVERQLAFLSPEEIRKYPRCKAAPPTDTRTLIVARRAR